MWNRSIDLPQPKTMPSRLFGLYLSYKYFQTCVDNVHDSITCFRKFTSPSHTLRNCQTVMQTWNYEYRIRFHLHRCNMQIVWHGGKLIGIVIAEMNTSLFFQPMFWCCFVFVTEQCEWCAETTRTIHKHDSQIHDGLFICHVHALSTQQWKCYKLILIYK
jgi:hypothetical protein